MALHDQIKLVRIGDRHCVTSLPLHVQCSVSILPLVEDQSTALETCQQV